VYFPLRRAFGEGGSLHEVAQMLANDRMYRDPTSLVTFLDNHDVSRFMNDRGATVAGLKLAYTFLLTTRGTPLLYYGDEIGLPGGGDPDNRRDFPGGWREDAHNAFEASGRTADEQAVFSHLRTLLKLRAEHAELRGPVTVNLVTNEQVLVYRRGKLVVALNNDTAQAVVLVPQGGLGADLLGLCATPRIEANAPVVVIPQRSGCIFPVTAETIPGPVLGVRDRLEIPLVFPLRP
jgi:glycosidase